MNKMKISLANASLLGHQLEGSLLPRILLARARSLDMSVTRLACSEQANASLKKLVIKSSADNCKASRALGCHLKS